MSVTTRANINSSGQVLQTWLNRTVIENLEPELRFYDMGKKSMRKSGYNTLAWTRVRQFGVSAASAALAEGITPVEQNLQMETISMQANQYGLYVTISDLLDDTIAIDLVEQAAKELGYNMARIMDSVIQSNLATNGTNVIYANNSAGPRSALTSADTFKAADLSKAKTFLTVKGSKQIGRGYAGVFHPNTTYDLMQQSGTGTFIDLNKYTDANANKPLAGEIGLLFGVRVIESAFIQTFASNVTVYPAYIMGQEAYGVANLQDLQTYITPRAATDSDPLAQRRKVGCKVAFNSIILQQNSLVRIEGASTLSYAWSAV